MGSVILGKTFFTDDEDRDVPKHTCKNEPAQEGVNIIIFIRKIKEPSIQSNLHKTNNIPGDPHHHSMLN